MLQRLRIHFFSALLILLLGATSLGQETESAASGFEEKHFEAVLSYKEALTLGLVEGLTEFLPPNPR